MRIALIDFSNFIYKYKNSIRAKSQQNGVDTDISPLIGIERTLRYTSNFDSVILCLDGYPKHFSEIFPDYKGNRERKQPEFNTIKHSYILAYAVSVAEDYNIPLIIAASLFEEADQVISSIVHKIKQNIPSFFQSTSEGFLSDDPFLKKYSDIFSFTNTNIVFPIDTEVVIGTTDADMYQLAAFDNVFISNDIVCKTVQYETPKAVHNLPPHTIPAFKALFGDVSDNISKTFDPKIISTKQVLELLKTDLSTPDNLDYFVKCLKAEHKDNLSPLLKVLYSSVLPNRSNFLANLEITRMRYYSTPKTLILKDRTIPQFVKDTYLKRRTKSK